MTIYYALLRAIKEETTRKGFLQATTHFQEKYPNECKGIHSCTLNNIYACAVLINVGLFTSIT